MFNLKKAVYSCYIIDDENHCIEAVSDLVSRIPELCLMGSNTNPIAAIAEINSGMTPDIVLLDVEMPQMFGINVIDKLPKTSAIILVTGHSKYAFNGFEQDVVDFLLKPISFVRFTKSIHKALSFLEKAVLPQDQTLFISPIGKTDLIPVKIDSILYLEADDHTLNIHIQHDIYRIKSSLKAIEEKLPRATFVRVHRSFIINMKYIQSINSADVILMGNINIPKGDAYRKELLSVILP